MKEQVSVFAPLHQQCRTTPEAVAEALSRLLFYTGRRLNTIVPPQIRAPEELRAVMGLSATATILSRLPGFSDFTRTWAPAQLESAYTTARLAHLLHSAGGLVELEPPIVQTGKTCDLRLEIAGAPLFVECKRVQVDLRQHEALHRKVAEEIARGRPVPGVVLLEFLEESALTLLPDVVKRISRFASAPNRHQWPADKAGYVRLRNSPLEVLVRLDGDRYHPSMDLTIPGLNHEDATGNVLPMHLFGLHGWRVGVRGPLVQRASMLKEALRRAARQAPLDAPYVLCIDGSTLTGNSADVKEWCRREFTPTQNRRFSGILVMDSSLTLTRSEPLDFTPNPHARNPLPVEFESLVREVNIHNPRVKEYIGSGEQVELSLSVPWVEYELELVPKGPNHTA